MRELQKKKKMHTHKPRQDTRPYRPQITFRFNT